MESSEDQRQRVEYSKEENGLEIGRTTEKHGIHSVLHSRSPLMVARRNHQSDASRTRATIDCVYVCVSSVAEIADG